MSMYTKMYTKKPKKVRDPSLPPPPTLLGQVKELRLAKEESAATRSLAQRQQAEINELKAKLNRLAARFDALTSYVKNLRK